MNYKEKFLNLFKFFKKNQENLDNQDPSKRNGKHLRVEEGVSIEEWYKNGILHREDGPASIKDFGNGVSIKEWYLNGQPHRENGPAFEHSNGQKKWYKNGIIHRENGPAVEHANGQKEWLINGVYHRENGPAIEGNSHTWYKNGHKHRIGGPAYYELCDDHNLNPRQEWWENGKLHRVDGPAIVDSNYSEWRLYGKKHRADGPAISEKRSNKFHLEWWVNDQQLSFEAFKNFLINEELQNESSIQMPFARPGKKLKV